MKNLYFFLALSLLLAGCPKPTPHPHPVEPTDTASCHDACVKLRSIGCEEGETLPKAYCSDGSNSKAGKCGDGSDAQDLTCELFCTTTQQGGHALKPSCVVQKVSKCADIQTQCNEK
jgi:hypothetical protein